MINNDTMKGLFIIMKGQYAQKKGIEFVNKVSGDVNHIGGYDPDDPNTPEWYMCYDTVTWQCTACGSDFNKVVKSVYTQIMRYKGSLKKYLKHVSDVTSDDTYEVRYLGATPLTHDQRQKKAEGRCPRTSPIMVELYKHINEHYGDYYSDEIKEQEDLAYSELVEERPTNKTKKLMKRAGGVKKTTPTPVETPPKTEEHMTLKKVKPKAKLGLKRL